jgi:hypothetical protein
VRLARARSSVDVSNDARVVENAIPTFSSSNLGRLKVKKLLPKRPRSAEPSAGGADRPEMMDLP